MIKEHQPEAKVVVGNSVGGSIPEVLFQTTKVDVVIYGEAEVTVKELFDALKMNKSLGEIVEPHVEIPHSDKRISEFDNTGSHCNAKGALLSICRKH